MELIYPSYSLKAEFNAFCQDYLEHDVLQGGDYLQAMSDFNHYVAQLLHNSRSEDLPSFQTACSHFWAVVDTQIVGTLRLRHSLRDPFLATELGHIGYDIAPSFRRRGYAKAMLCLSFAKAVELGIFRLLITADESNIASRRVIEANGGILDSIIMGPILKRKIARYWIELV
ncbi:GNAT family N-acetyltransferase [Celerinatantimonas sp. YJH-8]|uniref:GNAT family N-acetyltransferase n=1 Tax=Celerinatantimonas sp. YJH-8 TaxID=3228714 RepID=UPI0038C46CA7